MTKGVFVCVLWILVFCTPCAGKKTTDIPKDTIHYNSRDTVTAYGPNSMVRNVKQGRNGTILIAAWKGIFRYDGKSFTNITSKISSPSFWDVLEDRNGNLWLATRDSGVYYYDGKSFQQFTTRQGLANNFVCTIYEDRAGIIWLGTGDGVSRYDGKSFRNFSTKDGLSNNSITTILEDKTGKLWFGTRGEPCFYDGKTFTVFRNKAGKAFTNVWSIIEDKKGAIWLGDNDGLWRYDGSSYTLVSKRGASAMIEDKKGNIWTTGSIDPPNGKVWALSRYDQSSLYNAKPTVTEVMSIEGPGMLCGLLEATDGSIWFGALGSTSGVFRYDGKTITDFRKNKIRNNG
ncbi:histidine kinase [Spirosoma sp. BT702]|uniref:Histidine kinase n=1 Tax=Spirosoma profusum TaxID=2771354 RepID=A0A927AVH2_9BACT|nr:two-component regulator propeller domain-containing protein [Spirosoma profusum]MBD2705185.1 histidine kinase [Spirosoma profusum]